MRLLTALYAFCVLLGAPSNGAAQEEAVVRHGRPGAMLLESVEVTPSAKMIFIGGYAASPIDPSDRSKGFGDTKTQTINTLKKIQAVLERRGFTMSDVIKLNIFVVADPAIGKADYEGVNAGFKEFFLTSSNPNTVARTALEVEALQHPALYVEIEGVAAH